nr:hypothetical protein [Tanacetum cinerariifolium]
EESAKEETREEEEESFDLIPRTPEDSEDDGNGKDDQGLRGRGLQVSQDIEDSHVTLTPVHLDGQQESSSVSSFVTSITASSSVAPLPTPIPTMTPFIITTITTASHPSIPPTPIPNKTILESYGDTAILKRRRGDDDDQEGTFARSDRGSKRRREGGEPESASTPSKPPRKPPTPDCDWNKTFPAVQGSAQTWISELAKHAVSRSSCNELLDTPIDFSKFIMNRLCVDTLTPELLAGPTYKLMRGSCNSLTELEYHLEEVYKATTDQLDWVNPEGQQEFLTGGGNVSSSTGLLLTGNLLSMYTQYP